MIIGFLYVLAALIAFGYTIALLEFAAWAIDSLTEMVLERAVKDEKFKNDFASKLYFLKDMAPSVSSVSVIALFVVTDAPAIKLIALFFFGYAMKMVARRLINAFYAAIDERKENR